MAVHDTHTTDTLARANADPTRTTTLRRRYAQRLRGRFAAINTEIRAGVRERDIFGLNRETDTLATPPPSFRFATDAEKAEGFREWLDRQLDAEVLQTIGPNRNQFLTEAYRRGLRHAETSLRQAGISVPAGGVEAAIVAPLHRDALETLYTRNFRALEGITAEVGTQISRELTDGLQAGIGPRDMARNLTDRVDAIGKTRATVLARTEVINAHAEATLNRYDELDVEGVTVRAEWQTAGDARVCPICQALEGRTWTIQEARETRLDLSGRVPDDVSGASDVPVKPPAHPQCRCALIPA